PTTQLLTRSARLTWFHRFKFGNRTQSLRRSPSYFGTSDVSNPPLWRITADSAGKPRRLGPEENLFRIDWVRLSLSLTAAIFFTRWLIRCGLAPGIENDDFPAAQ